MHFTKPAITLLSIVSGVSESRLMGVEVDKSGPFSSVYHYQKAGGAITTDKVRYSKQFFNGGENDNVNSWLRLSSHEVGHVPQYDAIGDDSKYQRTAAWGYVTSLGHDGAPMEIEADKGRKEFKGFVKSAGLKAINDVFNSNSTDDEKSNQIISLYQTHLRKQVEGHISTLQSMNLNDPNFEKYSNQINNRIQKLQKQDDDLEQRKSYNKKTIPRK